MADYDNTNRGGLWKNTRKEKETHADWTGNLNVDGKEFYVSAWVKTKKDDGSKFFSLSVKPKDAPRATSPAPAPRRAPVELDDEVPF